MVKYGEKSDQLLSLRYMYSVSWMAGGVIGTLYTGVSVSC